MLTYISMLTYLYMPGPLTFLLLPDAYCGIAPATTTNTTTNNNNKTKTNTTPRQARASTHLEKELGIRRRGGRRRPRSSSDGAPSSYSSSSYSSSSSSRFRTAPTLLRLARLDLSGNNNYTPAGKLNQPTNTYIIHYIIYYISLCC